MSNNAKQPWQVTGTTIYTLEHDGWHRGVEQMRNRWSANVQGYRDTPKEELESVARLMASAPTLLKLLTDIADSQYAEWPVESLHDAVSKAREYLASLPKGE